MTYRAAPPRTSGDVSARVLLARRFVMPCAGVGLLALLGACIIAAHARAALTIQPYAAPRSRPATRDVLVIPAHVDVASYSLRTGALGFGLEATGELEDFYSHARVVGTAVSLSEPRGRPSVPEDSDNWSDRPRPASYVVSLGPEPYPFGPGDERVASAIETWMRGKHEAPLRMVWWTALEPETYAFAAIAGLAVVVLLLASRTRVRVATEGALVEIESRSAFGRRRSTLARNEVRKVKVESRVLGPFVFARPVVVTNERRKIPVGPRCMTDEAAADLARHIRALLA